MLLSQLLAKAKLVTPISGTPVMTTLTRSTQNEILTIDLQVGNISHKSLPDQEVHIDEEGLVTLHTHKDTFMAQKWRYRVVIPYSAAALHADDLKDLLSRASEALPFYRGTEPWSEVDEEFLVEATNLLEKC